jgi:hypothetical protein
MGGRLLILQLKEQELLPGAPPSPLQVPVLGHQPPFCPADGHLLLETLQAGVDQDGSHGATWRRNINYSMGTFLEDGQHLAKNVKFYIYIYQIFTFSFQK